jgi:hypothetical protein
MDDIKIFGPLANNKYLTKPIITHINRCTQYLYSLSEFDRYIVWRYTIGSASLNNYLIFGTYSDNTEQWARLFFRYIYNTNDKMVLPRALYWQRFLPYCRDINKFNELQPGDRILLSQGLINAYIATLTKIINNSPPVVLPFHVYKASSRYPGVPTLEEVGNGDIDIPQLPFNSTSINPNFNFSMFLGADGVLWDIYIPAGNRVLSVPSQLHAYPWEAEIILPPCIFSVVDGHRSTLKTIDKGAVNLDKIQSNNIMMGAVYQIDEVNPCNNGSCVVGNITIDTVFVP